MVNYSGHSCFQHVFTGHLPCARDCSRLEVSKPWAVGQIWPTRCSVFGFSLPDSLMSGGLNKAKFFQLIHILSKLNMNLKHPVLRLFKLTGSQQMPWCDSNQSLPAGPVHRASVALSLLHSVAFGSHIMSILSDAVTSSIIHDSLNDTQINHHKPWFL